MSGNEILNATVDFIAVNLVIFSVNSKIFYIFYEQQMSEDYVV